MFLVRSEILGLLVNTLIANYKYARSNLPLPIQMQSPEKLKTFSEVFIIFLKSTLNSKQFEKNEDHSSSISQVIDYERRAYINS